MSDWLTRSIHQGSIVVDVGANLGSITSQFQQLGGEVWAVEPDPRCHSTLLTFVDATHLIPYAVGSHSGTAMLYRSRQAAHNSLYEVNILEGGTVPALYVPLESLDGLQDLGLLPPTIDVIKVDAQGAEAEILRGAARICQIDKPLWYVEFWPSGLDGAGDSLRALCDLFEDYGYVPEGEDWTTAYARVSQLGGHSSQDLLLIARE